MLLECSGKMAQLEEREFASTALPPTKGNHGGAYSGPHIHRSTTTFMGTAAIETVHVAMTREAADGKLVQPRHGDLTRMGMAGENKGNATVPQPVGLLGDMTQAEDGKIPS